MSKKLLPLAVFLILASILAMADFYLMNNVRPYNIIWRYPSKESTLAGALWFSEVCAAILTPLAVRFVFRVKQFFASWTLLAVLAVVNLLVAAYRLMDSPFHVSEIVWRTFHMPMTSIQTMTFETSRDFLIQFVSLQFVLGFSLGIGALAGHIFLGKRKMQQS